MVNDLLVIALVVQLAGQLPGDVMAVAAVLSADGDYHSLILRFYFCNTIPLSGLFFKYFVAGDK